MKKRQTDRDERINSPVHANKMTICRNWNQTILAPVALLTLTEATSNASLKSSRNALANRSNRKSLIIWVMLIPKFVSAPATPKQIV